MDSATNQVSYYHLLAGASIPAEIGFSIVKPDGDFETYSEAGYVWHPELEKWKSLPGLSDQNRGLGAVGTRNYVCHPSFRLLSLAYNLKDGTGEHWWRPDPYTTGVYPRYTPGQRDRMHPWKLLEHIAAGGLFEAWNVYFEWQVWTFYCVPVLGWPPLPMEQCDCAMAKSRACGYPGKLEEAGPVIGTVQRKGEEGKKLVRKLTVPRNPTKANSDLRWTPFTATEDFQKFYEYNKQDIRTEAEISSKLPDLTERERQIWLTDFRINMRGMCIDMDAVEDCIAIIEQAEIKYNAELLQLTGHRVASYTETAKIISWAQLRGVYLHELKEEALQVYLDRAEYPPDVLRVLRIRQMLAYGSVRKFYALRAQVHQGRLYDQYVYYGAHTSLWNGRGFQPANLYKGIFDKPEKVERALSLIKTRCLELIEYEFPKHDALEIIASCLRSMIIASPGHRLLSADFSSIQAVATSCMANELWRIEVFRTHGQIYYEMAARLTNKTLQFYLDYEAAHRKKHEDRQRWGKLPVLSGDFGAWIPGWKRFGADKILGADENIKAAILKTRDAQPNIVNYWGGQTVDKFKPTERPMLYGLEGAALSAILEPGKCFINRPGSRIPVLYQMFEDTLFCKMPSGSYIRYHAPRLAKSTRDYASPWEMEITYEGNNSSPLKGKVGWLRMKAYGGIFTQNTISHMCREIQADGLMALEAAGYPIVMHTHDENVTEIPHGHGSVSHYMEVLRGSLAKWAVCEDGQPWPVKVPDAWEAQRYGKWED